MAQCIGIKLQDERSNIYVEKLLFIWYGTKTHPPSPGFPLKLTGTKVIVKNRPGLHSRFCVYIMHLKLKLTSGDKNNEKTIRKCTKYVIFGNLMEIFENGP